MERAVIDIRIVTVTESPPRELHRSQRRPQSLHGFTLAEMVMALVVTSLIAMAVAGVSMALATANDYSQDYYQSIQTGRSVMMRMQSSLRKASLVTCSMGDSVVIWSGDTNDDGQINIRELILLEHDGDTQAVNEHTVVFPDHFSDEIKAAMDTQLSLSAAMDWNTVSWYLTRYRYSSSIEIATDVKDFSIGTDVAPPITRMVTVEIKLGSGERELTLRSAVTLRADKTSDVGIADGEYVLTGP